MPPSFTPNIQWTLLRNPPQRGQAQQVYGALTLYGPGIPAQVQPNHTWNP